MEMLQIEVVSDLGNGRRVVRQQVIDVPAKKYQPSALYLAYPVVPTVRRRSAQSLHRLNEKSLRGDSSYVLHATVASQYRHSTSLAFVKNHKMKTSDRIGKERRKSQHKPDFRHVDIYH